MRASFLLSSTALMLLAPLASATLTIYEPFAYGAGGTLANGNGGTGFSAAWPAGASTHTLGAADTSLSYPASSPLTTQGNRLQIAATAVGGISATRALATGAQMNLGTSGLGFYASALISISELGQTVSVRFTDSVTPTPNTRFAFGINAAGNFYNSVSPDAAGQIATGLGVAQLNTTYLVVAYYRNNTGTGGNDEVFIKAYAPTDTVVMPANDNSWDARSSGNSGVILSRMTITANNPTTTGTTVQMDEVRVGTTFMDVTGVIPEPASALLSGIALGLGLVRRRRCS